MAFEIRIKQMRDIYACGGFFYADGKKVRPGEMAVVANLESLPEGYDDFLDVVEQKTSAEKKKAAAKKDEKVTDI